MSIGIYKIVTPSGKVYIGQSIKILERIKSYKRVDITCKRQPKLYRSLKNMDGKIMFLKL